MHLYRWANRQTTTAPRNPTRHESKGTEICILKRCLLYCVFVTAVLIESKHVSINRQTGKRNVVYIFIIESVQP